MSTAFTRTMQALEAGGFRRNAAALLVGGGLLAGWAWWFWFSRLPRYEVTDTARIEADQASHLIQARVGGQVVASRLDLGRRVKAKEVLVELDSNPERLQLQEESSRLRTIEPELRALEDEVAAAEQAGQREREATGVAVEEARARLEEAEALARLAATEADRLRQLLESGLIPERARPSGSATAPGGGRKPPAGGRAGRARAADARQRPRSAAEKRPGRDPPPGRTRVRSAAALERLKYEIERRLILGAGRRGKSWLRWIPGEGRGYPLQPQRDAGAGQPGPPGQGECEGWWQDAEPQRDPDWVTSLDCTLQRKSQACEAGS